MSGENSGGWGSIGAARLDGGQVLLVAGVAGFGAAGLDPQPLATEVPRQQRAAGGKEEWEQRNGEHCWVES